MSTRSGLLLVATGLAVCALSVAESAAMIFAAFAVAAVACVAFCVSLGFDR